MIVEFPFYIKIPEICNLPAKISWIASDESSITSGQILAIISPLDQSIDEQINTDESLDHMNKKRRVSGTVKNVIKAPELNNSARIKWNVSNDSTISSYNTIIGTVSHISCNHLVVVHGLCVDCNEEVEVGEDSFDIDDVVRPGFITNEVSMSISATFVKQMEESNLHSLLNKRLLCLVLDLDNTLIHAKTLDKNETIESNDEFKVVYFGGRGNLYRLRPGVIEFLTLMSKHFQLYLFTMGVSEHASAALSLLDSDRILFSNRVFSRSDSYNSRKTLSRIFPNYKGIVCIVDDCEHAWKTDLSGAGFFKIHPYYYFSEKSKQHNPYTAMITAAANQSYYNTATKGDQILFDKNTFSPVYLDGKPVDNDKMLYTLGNLLIQFHTFFFQKLDEISKSNNMEVGLDLFKKSGISIGAVIEHFRSQVLKGVKLKYNSDEFGCDFLNSDYIAWAKAFGATIVSNDDIATHKLVLNPPITDKSSSNTAEANDITESSDENDTKEVHLMWLDKCLYTWVKGDEPLYNPSQWVKPYRTFWDISSNNII